jgi:Ca-activated chloride channel homolog
MTHNRYLLTFLTASLLLAVYYSASRPTSAQETVRDRTAGPQQTPTPRPTPTPFEDDTIEKIETELVNLDVRVIDRLNRPIRNLRQSDFQIFEDNQLQQIEFFSESEVPTNYSLVVDNSGSMRSQIERVIEAGKILISANRPDDETSVIRFIGSDKIEILQDFTSNKDDLEYALDNMYIGCCQTALIDAVYLAAERVTEYEMSPRGRDDKRRALILISDGEDRASHYKEPQLFALLRETTVQIYVVGFIKDLDDRGGFISRSAQAKAKSFLEKLASETGGKAYFPNDISELNNIARNISVELRTQYSIGYLPTNNRPDGTFRNIRVNVTDGPNREKRIAVTRSGRTAAAEGAPPSLQKTSSPRPNP